MESPDPTLVYLVDDDDAVRNGFARLLRSAGLVPRPYENTEDFLRDYMQELHAFIVRVMTVLPRGS